MGPTGLIGFFLYHDTFFLKKVSQNDRHCV